MKLSDHLQRLISSGSFPIYIFLVLLSVPNIILAFTEPVSTSAAVAGVLLPCAVYYVLLTISPNLGMVIWLFFPVIFLAAFQIVLLWLYGRSIIAVDMFLNLVTTNPGEVEELLSNMWVAVIIVILLYIPPLLAATMMSRRRMRVDVMALRRHRRRAAAFAALAVTVAFCSAGQWTFADNIFPVNVVNNARLAVMHTVKVNRHEEMSRNFTWDISSIRDDSRREVIVLVVGETSRADHWGINGYRRATDSCLSDIPGRFFSFRLTMSESNTTHKSVPLMLTHLTPENYGDSIYCVRSVITAFREAGFATAFLSCQRHNRSFIDMFGQEADTCMFIRESDSHANDLSLLKALDDIIAGGARRQLIVLHCYGSHFSYRDRYPASQARFLPDSYDKISRDNVPALINAYDNTIVLTARLLEGIARRLVALPGTVSAMIYSSDHGEDILDDERGLFLHASPCPSFYQLYVPFFVWLSPSYCDAYGDIVGALAQNVSLAVASNRAYVPTALGLAGIVSGRVDTATSLASWNYQPPQRLYLDDHNRGIPLREAGLTAHDIMLVDSLDSMAGHR